MTLKYIMHWQKWNDKKKKIRKIVNLFNAKKGIDKNIKMNEIVNPIL